jgi:hypothetical protein
LELKALKAFYSDLTEMYLFEKLFFILIYSSCYLLLKIQFNLFKPLRTTKIFIFGYF